MAEETWRLLPTDQLLVARLEYHQSSLEHWDQKTLEHQT